MDHLAFASLLVFVFSLVNAVFVFLSRPRNLLKSLWGLICLTVSVEGIYLFQLLTTVDAARAYDYALTVKVVAIFIPVFFFHFTLLLTNRLKQKTNELVIYYVIAIVYAVIAMAYPRHFIAAVGPISSLKYYARPGILFYFLPIFFAYLMGYGLALVYRSYRNALAIKRNQLKYFFIGCFLGIMGGLSMFFPLLNIPLYPWGMYLVSLGMVIVAYAIAKHHLMDIQLVLGWIFPGTFARIKLENVQLHEEMLALERYKTFGEIASVLRAEIHGPLERIKANPSKEALEQEVKSIEEALRQLDEYSRPLTMDFKVINVVEVLDGLFKGMNIFKYYQPNDVVKVLGDDGQLRRAFGNIIAHCIQSIQKGGDIFVTVERDKKWAEISIRHSGHGLNAQEVEGLFQPSFKTDRFKGALAMILAQTIFFQHGGKIMVESETDVGTEFFIELPVV